MSKTGTVPSGKTNNGGSDSEGYMDAKAYMRDTDERLARLHRTILPETPYILTVPSDLPYNLHPSQKHEWRRDTPFGPHEEQLQYMSFLYREPGDSLIVLRTEREMQQGYGREKSLKHLSNGVMSGTNTPLHGQVGKKKITLSAYKSKRADGDVKTPSGTEQPHVQGGAVQKPQGRVDGNVAEGSKVEEDINGALAKVRDLDDKIDAVAHGAVHEYASCNGGAASKPLQNTVRVAAKENSGPTPNGAGVVEHASKPSQSSPLLAPRGQKRPLNANSEPPNSTLPLPQTSLPPAKKHRTTPLPQEASDLSTKPSAAPKTPKLPPLLAKISDALTLDSSRLPPLLAPISNALTLDSSRLPPLLSSKLGSQLDQDVESARRAHQHKASGPRQALSDGKALPAGQAATPTKGPEKFTPKSSDRYAKEEKGVARPKSTAPSPSLQGKQEIRKANIKADSHPGNKTESAIARGTKRLPSNEVAPLSITQKTPAHSSAAMKDGPRPIETKGETQTLIVKLKYGKSHRKDVERLLQMPPTKAKEKASVHQTKESEHQKETKLLDPAGAMDKDKPIEKERGRREGRDEGADCTKSKPMQTKKQQPIFAAKPVANVKEASTPKTSEKRCRPDHGDTAGEPSAKRHKAPESLDLGRGPRTPITPALQSPFSSHPPSTQKHNPSNLRKNLVPGAMERSSSSNGTVDTLKGFMLNGNTPTATTVVDRMLNGNTPTATAAVDRVSGPGHLSSSGSSNVIGAEVNALEDEFKKYIALGRGLKHEHREIANRYDADKLDEVGIRRCAVLGVEVILCFMLAFALKDQAECLQQRRDRASAGWRSNLELLEYIRDRCRKVPHLEGLCAQLESIIFQRILALEPLQLQLERDGHRDFRVKVDNDSAYTYAMEGEKRLPLTTITSVYPRTWQKRSLNPPVEEELKLDKLQGEFFLPLHSALTTPIQGVRMGVCLLKEYADREKLDFEPRVLA